jgi:hypothetical protein
MLTLAYPLLHLAARPDPASAEGIVLAAEDPESE